MNPILLSEYLDAQEGSCIGISKCLCIKLTLWKEASCLHSDGRKTLMRYLCSENPYQSALTQVI